MTEGHNSKEQLKSIIERIENLESQKAEIASDIRDVYTEAASNGFDRAALRAIIKMRKEDANKRREREELIETYMNALGMLSDTPLGRAAIDRATV